MIGLLDYDSGNLGSWKRLLNYLKEDFKIIDSEDQIKKSSKIILPGVGSFDHAMQVINELKILDVLKNEILNGKPILGVCLGMQIFGNNSEEGILDGFKIINDNVEVIDKKSRTPLRIPHVGFNKVFTAADNESKFLSIANNNDFYFVHSYAFPINKNYLKNSLICQYQDIKFLAGLHLDNILLTQFHPEKSGEVGIKLIKEFLDS